MILFKILGRMGWLWSDDDGHTWHEPETGTAAVREAWFARQTPRPIVKQVRYVY